MKETIAKPLRPGAGETPSPPKDVTSWGGAVSAAQNEKGFAITSKGINAANAKRRVSGE